MTYEGESYHADYSTFTIGAESDNYRMTISGFSGDHDDGMAIHNDMQFSTYERDNDMDTVRNCAEQFTGGWWYNKCLLVHPTGTWGSREHIKGIMWRRITGNNENLSSITMKGTPTT